MSNKNEVFEYLIDQLRQQLPVVDVMGEIKRWSIDRSIAGRGNYTDEENAVIDAYIGLEHDPYKKQCEDLAHEVQSLKNQLRDASEQIKELHMALVRATGDAEAYKLIRKGGCIDGGHRYVVGEHVPVATVNCRCAATPVPPEQSGCRKEDVQECEHSWIIMPGLFLSEGNPNNVPGSELCSKCGKREWDNKEYKPKNDTQKCKHEWQFYGVGFPCMCLKCGLKK